MNGGFSNQSGVYTKGKDSRRHSSHERGTGQRDTEYSGLTKNDSDFIREQFIFYDKHKTGLLDRFELKLVMDACGYVPVEEKLKAIHEYLDEKKIEKIDINVLMLAISYLKDLELKDEELVDNEYVDAFVALGGEPDRSGTIKKTTLIQIIKMEFELPIDMEDYLQSIGGPEEHINFFQFCTLLDAGTSGNPSRVSSLISNRTISYVN